MSKFVNNAFGRGLGLGLENKERLKALLSLWCRAILDITQDPVAICQYEYQPCNDNSSVVNSINTKFVLCLCCDGITPLEYTCRCIMCRNWCHNYCFLLNQMQYTYYLSCCFFCTATIQGQLLFQIGIHLMSIFFLQACRYRWTHLYDQWYNFLYCSTLMSIRGLGLGLENKDKDIKGTTKPLMSILDINKGPVVWVPTMQWHSSVVNFHTRFVLCPCMCWESVGINLVSIISTSKSTITITAHPLISALTGSSTKLWSDKPPISTLYWPKAIQNSQTIAHLACNICCF